MYYRRVGGFYFHVSESEWSDVKLTGQRKALLMNMNVQFLFIHPY